MPDEKGLDKIIEIHFNMVWDQLWQQLWPQSYKVLTQKFECFSKVVQPNLQLKQSPVLLSMMAENINSLLVSLIWTIIIQ